jgi:hypothetical protein
VTEFNYFHHYLKGNVMEKQIDTNTANTTFNFDLLRDLLDSEVVLVGGGELIAEFH